MLVPPFNEVLTAHLDALGEGGRAVLARELVVSDATVSRWVNNQAVPEEWRASAIARVIGKDEAVVLAAIALSRKIRSEAQMMARARLARDETLRAALVQIEELEMTVASLTGQVADLTQQLAVMRQRARRRSGGPNASQR